MGCLHAKVSQSRSKEVGWRLPGPPGKRKQNLVMIMAGVSLDPALLYPLKAKNFNFNVDFLLSYFIVTELTHRNQVTL